MRQCIVTNVKKISLKKKKQKMKKKPEEDTRSGEEVVEKCDNSR